MIVFGGREDAAPFSYWDGSEFAGYTIELCHKVFEKYKEDQGNQNLKLEIVPVTAKDRLAALEQGRIQALCGATTITVSRMRAHHFSLMIYLSGASVMKRLGTEAAKLDNPKYLKQKIKVSYVGDTTTEAHVKRLLGASVSPLGKTNHMEAFEALQNEEVDFYFGDRAILRERLRKAEDPSAFILAPGFLSYEPYAIAIHRANHDLLFAANAALAALYRTGEIDKIYKRWFGDAQKSDLLKSMFKLHQIPE
jgi:ABC-type amino acid transport substrate-binding protein